jgi:hypothetical protein
MCTVHELNWGVASDCEAVLHALGAEVAVSVP